MLFACVCIPPFTTPCMRHSAELADTNGCCLHTRLLPCVHELSDPPSWSPLAPAVCARGAFGHACCGALRAGATRRRRSASVGADCLRCPFISLHSCRWCPLVPACAAAAALRLGGWVACCSAGAFVSASGWAGVHACPGQRASAVQCVRMCVRACVCTYASVCVCVCVCGVLGGRLQGHAGVPSLAVSWGIQARDAFWCADAAAGGDAVWASARRCCVGTCAV
jgi:hypothetical protein